MEKSEMKHAYLIMAHHEFEVLGKLVQAIDDKRYIYSFRRKTQKLSCAEGT